MIAQPRQLDKDEMWRMRGGILTFKASRLHTRHLESFLVSIVFLRNCSRQYASTGNRGLEKTGVNAAGSDRERQRGRWNVGEGSKLQGWSQLERMDPSRVGRWGWGFQNLLSSCRH